MYVCMSKLSKFVFATAIQLQPKNIKSKREKKLPTQNNSKRGYLHTFYQTLGAEELRRMKKDKNKNLNLEERQRKSKSTSKN